MKQLVLATVASLIFSTVSLANTGVFFGAGNQVIPIKNDQIQLVKENVSIRLTVDESNGKFGVPFIPWANVTAVFHLKNTADSTVNLQIGFPFLNLQGFGDEKFVLDNLAFNVSSDGKKIETSLKEGLIEEKLDPKGLFKKVFAWEDTFAPAQEKVVTVRYKLLMGVASANSIFRNFDPAGRKYYEIDELIPAVNFSFMYITGTAYTWKGPVSEAVFRFEADEFFKKFEDSTFASRFGFEGYTLTKPIFIESIFPANYKKDKATYEWVFSGKVPEEGLSVNFISVFIPSKPEELKPFTDHCIAKLNLANKNEFLSVLEQYYRAFASDKGQTDDFTSEYFKEVWLVRDENKLIYEKDHDALKNILSKIIAMTKLEK